MSRLVTFLIVSICTALLVSPVSAQSASSSPSPGHLLTIGVADSLFSEVLGEQRTFWIHLPNEGNLIEGQRYPVIYLLDAEMHLGGLATVQAYYNQFRMPEMIVVGISNANNRTRDLTPTKIASRNGAQIEDSGGADRFSQFLADELIPLIDETFPTTNHRVLVGHSYGGLFAVNTLLMRPELFTNIIALDPSLDWDNGAWMKNTMALFSSKDLSGKGLFVAVANEIIRFSDTLTIETVATDTSAFSEGIRSTLQFVHGLEDMAPSGLRFDWSYSNKDIHGSIPLVGMRDAFVFLYDFWELKKPSLYNDPNTPTETLVSLIRAQSEARTANMGYDLPMEEELLDMLGFMAMEMMGQPEKARAVLSISMEYYPQSANAHIGLMDVCLVLEDYSCAEEHASIADRLAQRSDNMEKVRAAIQSK